VTSVVDDYARMPAARHRHALTADRAGFLSRLDAGLIGRASSALGAGRSRVEDHIDYGVGIKLHRKPGDEVAAGEPILDLLYNDASGRDEAAALARDAIAISAEAPRTRPLVLGTVR
jgi:thymidine phosphorylase